MYNSSWVQEIMAVLQYLVVRLCIVGMANKNRLDQMDRNALFPKTSIKFYPNLYLVRWIGSYSYIFR